MASLRGGNATVTLIELPEEPQNQRRDFEIKDSTKKVYVTKTICTKSFNSLDASAAQDAALVNAVQDGTGPQASTAPSDLASSILGNRDEQGASQLIDDILMSPPSMKRSALSRSSAPESISKPDRRQENTVEPLGDSNRQKGDQPPDTTSPNSPTPDRPSPDLQENLPYESISDSTERHESAAGAMSNHEQSKEDQDPDINSARILFPDQSQGNATELTIPTASSLKLPSTARAIESKPRRKRRLDDLSIDAKGKMNVHAHDDEYIEEYYVKGKWSRVTGREDPAMVKQRRTVSKYTKLPQRQTGAWRRGR